MIYNSISNGKVSIPVKSRDWWLLSYVSILRSIQIHHVYYTLKRRGNGRFHVFSTWNTRDVFVGMLLSLTKSPVHKCSLKKLFWKMSQIQDIFNLLSINIPKWSDKLWKSCCNLLKVLKVCLTMTTLRHYASRVKEIKNGRKELTL